MPLNVTYSTGQKSSLTLADIDELYAATRDWDRSTRITISVDKGYNQLDPGGVTMSVTQDPRKNNQPKNATRDGGRPVEFL